MNQRSIYDMMHTNHLGDSGMKYNPGINIAHGKIPAKENTEMLHYIDKSFFIYFFISLKRVLKIAYSSFYKRIW